MVTGKKIWEKEIDIDQLNASASGLVKHLGIEFTEKGSDFLRAKMPVDDRTVQPYGILHGGATVSLAETLGSVASFFCLKQTDEFCVGIEINANHIKKASEGYVYGTARPFHLGKKTQVWDIQIHNKDNELVAISRLTLAVIKRK